MYAVEVSDHIMIAHSFRGEVFGPAQRLHGATFAISAAFMAQTLDANGIVVDIGRAFDVLKEVLGPLNYRNLDDFAEFKAVNTTTEFLTRHVFDEPCGGGEERPARPRRPRDRRHPGDGRGIPDRARLVRGSAVVALGFAVPGSIDQPTGGYTYDRRVIAGLRGLGCEVDIIDLGEGFPYPDAGTRSGALERLRAVPPGRPIVIDGLALGVLPEAAKALAATHPVVALVHHPLALEAGISPATAAAFAASERAALAAVRHVIVTSPSTRRVLVADYGVADAAVTVAVPGNRPVAAGREAAPRHASRCSRSARWCRARAMTSSSMRSPRSPISTGGSSLPAIAPAIALRRTQSKRRSPRVAWARGCACSAPSARTNSMRSTARPICSCWRRAMKATAWPSPPRSATACRWSARAPAPSRRRCRRARASWCAPDDVAALAAALRTMIADAARTRNPCRGGASGRGAIARLGHDGADVPARADGSGMSFSAAMAGAARAL